ncbi:MAG: TonB family protein [Proteobacteria bacterium]|nr:TonB family protein [Pseudomonadota bacterium]
MKTTKDITPTLRKTNKALTPPPEKQKFVSKSKLRQKRIAKNVIQANPPKRPIADLQPVITEVKQDTVSRKKRSLDDDSQKKPPKREVTQNPGSTIPNVETESKRTFEEKKGVGNVKETEFVKDSKKTEPIVFSRETTPVGFTKKTDLNNINRSIQRYLSEIDLMGYYPRFAKRKHIQGTVVVGIRLDRNAAISEIHLYRSSNYSSLDRAAIRLIKEHKNELERTLLKNHPYYATKLQLNVPIRFSLQ